MNKRGITSAALAGLLAGGAVALFAVSIAMPRLVVRMDGDFLRVSVAPHLNFLKDRLLERLKDGASVGFIAQLTIAPTQNSLIAEARSVARFALSYDVWEQKFSVTRFGERPEPPRSISHLLSAEATETWCLEHMTIERSLIPADRPFYVQLDLRAEDPGSQLGIVGESGINVTQIIDYFRTSVKGGPKPITVTSGPLRLADLRKAGPG